MKNPFFMVCPRKICQKKFGLKDLPSLTFNNTRGKFLCDNFLNLKVICGAQLDQFTEETQKNIEFSKNENKKTIDEIRPLINMLLLKNK